MLQPDNIYNIDLCGIRGAIARLEMESISDVIEHSTTMLDELYDVCTALLSTRARAFGEKGTFDQAIADASKAIEIRPASVQGYLASSEVYTMQGRHPLAISVLEEGLRAVLPSDWPLLYEKREVSMQSMETKVDFVRNLPSEINVQIFDLLGNDDDEALIGCTLVSKYWRSAILGYSRLWEVAEFGMVNRNRTASLLQSVSMHVKKLTFYPSRSAKEYDSVLALASKSMLLHTTELATEAGLFSERKLNPGAFLGKQLNELVLCCVNWSNQAKRSDPVSLSSILIQCPNLRHLYLQFTYSPPNLIYFGSSKLSGPLKLQTVFSSFRGADDIAILEKLIPLCPSLLYLHTRSPEPRILSLLDQHCPDLKQLHMWSFFFFSPPKNSEAVPQSSSGLNKVYCEVSNADQIANLAPLLVKSKDSLQVLHLRLTELSSTMTVSDLSFALPDVEYSQLKEFHCHAKEYDESISKIMRQCPALDSVLLNVNDIIPDHFFLALAQLTHLRRLNIEAMQSCENLEQFFAYHAVRDQGSTLEGVQIQGCDDMTDDILYELASVVTLQTIIIRGRFPLTTPEGMSRFVRKLGANANLKFLFMQNVVLAHDSVEELESDVCLKVRCTPDEDSNSYQLGDVHDPYFGYF
ncbi:hypothetical protein BJV82DRAFT_708177 [Fennellomyces sp. T-0311]|nr:hypothetical protein BJV82DRAFT_708177 [Fennellomyces sp. T-0311]